MTEPQTPPQSQPQSQPADVSAEESRAQSRAKAPDGSSSGVDVRIRRLHPVSWLFVLWIEVRRFAVPAIALALTTSWMLTLWVLPGLVLLVYAVVRQLTMRYRLDDDELIVRTNVVIHRSERHIPYARIHNLRLTESPLHRFFQVVEVAVETAGGTEPEATLRVLSRAAFDELRTHIAAHARTASDVSARDADAAAAPGAARAAGVAGADAFADADADGRTAPRELLVMPLKEAVRYGALDNRGFVVAAALAGVVWEGVSSFTGGLPWEPQSYMEPWRLMERGWRWFQADAWTQGPLTLLAIVLLALAVLKLFSIAWAVATLYGFRVERTRNRLRVTRGLFTRASTLVPLHRIQQITLREKPLHRFTGYVELTLDTASSGGGGKEGGGGQPVWLAPLARREEVPRLLAGIGEPLALDDLDWQPLHARAARRMRRQSAILAFGPGLAVWLGAGAAWALAAVAVLLPLLLVGATMQARRFGYAVDGRRIAVRSGWIWRTTRLTWVDRVHALAVSESPFDRRHGMASLTVDTAAGGVTGTHVKVPFLGANIARSLQQQLATAVEATPFSW